MASRSMLKGKLMQWAAAQGQKVEWAHISALLQDFLHDMFRAPLQTAVNEDINKIVRDQETRESTSKTAGRLSRYHNVLFSGYMEKFGFSEVKAPHCEVSFGRRTAVDGLFEPSCSLDTPLPVEDIMGAVQFLASDASALVTGTALLIDGGWTAD